MSASQHLIAYAKQRERCYRIKKRFDMEKARAVSNIIRVAEFYKDKEVGPWMGQIIRDMLLLLPSQYGRYRKQRIPILTLIDQYEANRLSQSANGSGPPVVGTY